MKVPGYFEHSWSNSIQYLTTIGNNTNKSASQRLVPVGNPGNLQYGSMFLKQNIMKPIH